MISPSLLTLDAGAAFEKGALLESTVRADSASTQRAMPLDTPMQTSRCVLRQMRPWLSCLVTAAMTSAQLLAFRRTRRRLEHALSRIYFVQGARAADGRAPQRPSCGSWSATGSSTRCAREASSRLPATCVCALRANPQWSRRSSACLPPLAVTTSSIPCEVWPLPMRAVAAALRLPRHGPCASLPGILTSCLQVAAHSGCSMRRRAPHVRRRALSCRHRRRSRRKPRRWRPRASPSSRRQ